MLTHPTLALLQHQHFPATRSPLSPKHQGQDLFQSALPTAAAPNQRVSLWRKHSLNARHATRTVPPNISNLLSRRNTGKILAASLFPMGAVRMLIQWIIPSWKIKYLKKKKKAQDLQMFTVFKPALKAHKLGTICQAGSTWRVCLKETWTIVPPNQQGLQNSVRIAASGAAEMPRSVTARRSPPQCHDLMYDRHITQGKTTGIAILDRPLSGSQYKSLQWLSTENPPVNK